MTKCWATLSFTSPGRKTHQVNKQVGEPVYSGVEKGIFFHMRKRVKEQINICVGGILSIGGAYCGSPFSSILVLPVFEWTPTAQRETHPIFLPTKP